MILADIPTDQIVKLSLALLGLIIVGFIVVAQVRRRLQQGEETSGGAIGFTLADLRQMHKSGQMSDREFELAKAKIVDAARRTAARDEARKQGRVDALGRPLPSAPMPLETKPPVREDGTQE